MNNKLKQILKKDEKVKEWVRTPIAKWHGFTVEDMKNFGFHFEVQDWFNTLTDRDILDIARKKPLFLSSSPT